MKQFFSTRLPHVAVLIAAMQVGCSQPSSDVPVAQLSPSQIDPPAAEQAEIKIVNEQTPLSTGQDAIESYVVRKEVTEHIPQRIPEVFLSSSHSAMCRVRVEDELPEIKLPKLSGGEVSLNSLLGSQATVVLFWQPDRWMSHSALADLEREVVSSAEPGKVAVVGIAVKTPEEKVAAQVKTASASFPQLLDTDGKAFAKIGMVMLPRVYVLDASGKIVWFDIEYSESTRRELRETLEVLAGNE